MTLSLALSSPLCVCACAHMHVCESVRWWQAANQLPAPSSAGYSLHGCIALISCAAITAAKIRQTDKRYYIYLNYGAQSANMSQKVTVNCFVGISFSCVTGMCVGIAIKWKGVSGWVLTPSTVCLCYHLWQCGVGECVKSECWHIYIRTLLSVRRCSHS